MRTGQGRWMMITGVVPTEHSGKMQTEGISPKARVSCMTSVELNDLVEIGGSCNLAHSSESLCLHPCLEMGRRKDDKPERRASTTAPRPRLRPGHFGGSIVLLDVRKSAVCWHALYCWSSIASSPVLHPLADSGIYWQAAQRHHQQRQRNDDEIFLLPYDRSTSRKHQGLIKINQVDSAVD